MAGLPYTLMTSLREKHGRGAAFRLRLAVALRQVGRGVFLFQPAIRQAPGVEDGEGELRAGVGRLALLVLPPAPHADHEEQRQAQVVDEVPQRIARLEQAGALQHDDRLLASQAQPAGDGDGLALTANPDEAQGRIADQGALPLAQLAVGHPEDMRDAATLQRGRHGGTIEHRRMISTDERATEGDSTSAAVSFPPPAPSPPPAHSASAARGARTVPAPSCADRAPACFVPASQYSGPLSSRLPSSHRPATPGPAPAAP